MNIPAQIVGLFGSALLFLSFQKNDRRWILLFQCLASAVFCTHFIILGKYTRAAMNGLSAVRALVFLAGTTRKWARGNGWIVVFLVAFIAAGALTWDGPFSAFPIAAMLLATIALWVKTPRTIRLLVLPTSPCWFIYNAVSGSYSGCLTEIIVTVSLVIGIARFDIIPAIKKRRAERNGADDT